jgi:hypothetical protein
VAVSASRPLVDFSLERFDAAGVQQVFAISPFGASETRAERIVRLETAGLLVPDCEGCREFYEHPKLDPFAPRHPHGTTRGWD